MVTNEPTAEIKHLKRLPTIEPIPMGRWIFGILAFTAAAAYFS